MAGNSGKKDLVWFRNIAIAEGWSNIILFFIAMPLKYIFDFPLAVKLAGWVHGVLVIFYMLQLLKVAIAYSWSIKQLFIGFVCGIVPLSTFWYEKELKKLLN
ncbi:MAG: DUF3817 domain-containing protein [Bacteroidia bacterium]|jgi:integral membrane protein|nr:DUF3817 domain-containing protein [Bacteroidia bacterium]